MKILFILNKPPYGNDRLYNGLRLPGALSSPVLDSERAPNWSSSGIPRSGRTGLFGKGLGPATFRRPRNYRGRLEADAALFSSSTDRAVLVLVGSKGIFERSGPSHQ